MRVGIEAGRLGNGGQAILGELLNTLGARSDVDEVVVYGTTSHDAAVLRPGPVGRYQTFRWAISGWADQARRFDRALSFTGFARAPGQTVFVHNALYYDNDAAALLPLGMRLRLAVLRDLTADAIRSGRQVIVQSEGMRRAVWQHHGVWAHIICTVPPPSEPRDSGLAPDLLWVGNEVPFKDFRTAIAAATRLRRHLTLVGNTVPMPDGRYHHWLGDISREQVFDLYTKANVLIMTSHAESLGLPLAEALQVGLPVVALDRPYARELCGDHVKYFDDVEGLCAILRCEPVPSTVNFDSRSEFSAFAELVLS